MLIVYLLDRSYTVEKSPLRTWPDPPDVEWTDAARPHRVSPWARSALSWCSLPAKQRSACRAKTSSHTVRWTVPAEGGETEQVVVAFQAVKSRGLRRL